MTRRFILAACILAGFPIGLASAETVVTASDGRTYQLNDDGTYEIIAKSADGKTYYLLPNGTWHDKDEDAALEKRLTEEFAKAMSSGHGPRLIASDVPKYLACNLEIFRGFPIAARRLLLGGPDIQANYEKLQKAFPEIAKNLDAADRACKRGLTMADDVAPTPPAPELTLDARIAESISKFVDDEGKEKTADQRASIKTCMNKAVIALSDEAKNIILQVDDFERGARGLIHDHADLAGSLDDQLEVCF